MTMKIPSFFLLFFLNVYRKKKEKQIFHFKSFFIIIKEKPNK